MPRARATSAQSDTQMLLVSADKTEMSKLQRQLSLMERDCKAYRIQSQEHIRKQRQEISKLHEEQEELLRSLRVSDCQSRRRSDVKDTQSLRTLLDQSDKLDEQLEKEKQTQSQLKQEIKTMEKKLEDLRRGEISASQSHVSEAHHSQKATCTLENKLDRALVRFNGQLTKNRQLREEIETLHMERVRFQQLRAKLEKKLQDIHKEIGEVMDKSMMSYEAREEAQAKISMMKEKEEKDLIQYSAKMQELERVIASEQRLKEFMSIKCKERSTIDDEIGRRTEMKEQRKTDAGQETADTLEELFQKIQSVTGKDDLKTFVTKFIQAEDRNFALFNYVNEQSTEAEILKEQIHQIHKEMQQFHLEGLQREQAYQMDLKQVKDRQGECETQVQQFEAQADAISKTLDQIGAGVESVFGKLDCDRALVEDQLGSSTGIRHNSITVYLGLIEQKTTELLTIQAFINSKDDPKVVPQFLLGQNPEIERQTAVIQPSIDRDDNEFEDSPLTDKELLQSIMRQVQGSVHAGGHRDVKSPRSSTVSSSIRNLSLED